MKTDEQRIPASAIIAFAPHVDEPEVLAGAVS